MAKRNNSASTPFEVCFAWRRAGKKIIAVYKVNPEIELADGHVHGKVVEFVQCRIIGKKTIYHDPDNISSTDIRAQVRRLIGRSFDFPQGAVLGGALYIEEP
jgi:hypothetical protein